MAPGPAGPGDLAAVGRGAPGGTGEAAINHGPYIDALRARVKSELHYPLSARRRGLVGTAVVDVVIDPPGRPRSAAIVESSRHPELDAAALEAVRAAARLPMPPEIARTPVRVRLPVVFDLR
jgi:protein TonB